MPPSLWERVRGLYWWPGMILRALVPLVVPLIAPVVWGEGASVDTCAIHPVLCGHKLQAIDVCTLRSLYLRLAYQHAS